MLKDLFGVGIEYRGYKFHSLNEIYRFVFLSHIQELVLVLKKILPLSIFQNHVADNGLRFFTNMFILFMKVSLNQRDFSFHYS